MRKGVVSTLILSILLLGLILSFSFSQSPIFEITILYSNDFHGADLELLAKRATKIQHIRTESKSPVLVVDEGDIFTRGRYAKKFYGELEFAIMNELKYDAITLGNNEFKATNDLTAQKVLLDRIQQAKFPVLCGNVIDNKTNQYIPGVKPYLIKEVEGIKIGILGLTSTKINYYKQTKGWRCLDPIQTGESLFRDLKSKADIIIALTHIGIDQDRVLAEHLSGLSAIIGGDSHTILLHPMILNQIPIVQAGDSGFYLGKLVLSFLKKDSDWVLSNVEGNLIELNNDSIPLDTAVQKIIKDYLNRLGKKAS